MSGLSFLGLPGPRSEPLITVVICVSFPHVSMKAEVAHSHLGPILEVISCCVIHQGSEDLSVHIFSSGSQEQGKHMRS